MVTPVSLALLAVKMCGWLRKRIGIGVNSRKVVPGLASGSVRPQATAPLVKGAPHVQGY